MKQTHSMAMAIAAAAFDVPTNLVKRAAAEEGVMRDPKASQPYHQELCKIASAAFEDGGRPGSAEYFFFDALSKEASWNPVFNAYTDVVLRALHRAGQEKSASLPAAVAATGLTEKSGVPGMLKGLLAMGALGGTAAGSLAFLMSRNSRQSSASAAGDLEKIRTYHQLRREIEEDMKAEGLVVGDEEDRNHEL